jgi:glycosyltransferase involved in cell wall biosynthesis
VKDNFQINRDIKSILRFGNIDKLINPVFSIIIPTYNREETFMKALLSAINQDFEFEYEIVVVDNSEDFSDKSLAFKIIKELNSEKVFYFVNEKNIGASGNWNRGLELARGKFITFCHDDDMLLTNTLTTLYEGNKKFPNKAIFAKMHTIDMNDNFINYFDPNKRIKKILKHKKFYKFTLYDFLINNISAGVGCLFYRQHLLELGGYNEEYSPCGDYKINVDYTRRYGSVYCNIPTSGNRRGINDTLNCYLDIPKANYKICSEFVGELKFIPQSLWRYLLKKITERYDGRLKHYYGKLKLSNKCYPLILIYRTILKFKIYTFR